MDIGICEDLGGGTAEQEHRLELGPEAGDGRTTSHTPHLCTGCASLLLTPTCDANGSVLKPDNHTSSALALSVPGLWIQAVPD